MRTHRLSIRLLATVSALVASGIAGAQSSAPPPARSGSEYVVAFQGSAADATGAIRDAGGTTLDVNAAIGVALVSSSDSEFAKKVSAHGVVTGVAHNHAVGTSRPDMPHRFADERPETAGPPVTPEQAIAARGVARAATPRPEEPLNALQWDMQMLGANANGAHRTTTGRTVLVGVIDTGVDASHPDIAPNFDRRRSRNFTTDIPAIDGPCEYAGCVDPADVDDGGHGTHVAGTIAAKKNKLGIAGVAPRARIVNVRAGQDSGYFFLYETVAALTYAADAGLDVVNMSFYTDPWLFNCDSADDYLAGGVTPEQLSEQALTKQLVTAALEYAHAHGVTLVAAAGNDHVDLALPTRTDFGSPDYPVGTTAGRMVTSDCTILPGEGPHVIQVSAVGPSKTKSDYSNYGYQSIDVSAPGGFFRDFVGTPQFDTAENGILSTYPLHVAIQEGLADADGNPTSNASVKACNRSGRRCGFYTYLAGTSMAAPHVTGVVALIIEKHGQYVKDGKSLDPDAVRQILLSTATDQACPAGGVEDYTDEGRDPAFNAVCDGTTANNGLYGEGIVNALAAVQ
ncbi:MAG TPA: S8 family serine peptidase [Candidatus Binatia bacterium]|jgi:subtilisin family serine protease|nr:S8 family serine peptidase [Candidatus Binatia bacterium]